jgi:hypothetical protein
MRLYDKMQPIQQILCFKLALLLTFCFSIDFNIGDNFMFLPKIRVIETVTDVTILEV